MTCMKRLAIVVRTFQACVHTFLPFLLKIYIYWRKCFEQLRSLLENFS